MRRLNILLFLVFGASTATAATVAAIQETESFPRKTFWSCEGSLSKVLRQNVPPLGKDDEFLIHRVAARSLYAVLKEQYGNSAPTAVFSEFGYSAPYVMEVGPQQFVLEWKIPMTFKIDGRPSSVIATYRSQDRKVLDLVILLNDGKNSSQIMVSPPDYFRGFMSIPVIPDPK